MIYILRYHVYQLSVHTHVHPYTKPRPPPTTNSTTVLFHVSATLGHLCFVFEDGGPMRFDRRYFDDSTSEMRIQFFEKR